MVSIITKKINGNEYLYLVHSIRIKQKIIQKTIKYVGKKRPVPKEEFECMKQSYENKDWILDESNDKLSYQDHNFMKKASDAYQEYLENLDRISGEKEREKFLSKFISNSNAIEGSTLTPKDTYNFLFKDLSPDGHTKKEMNMATNMLKAWEYLEKNKKKFPNQSDIKKLHMLVNKEIEQNDTLGEYKKVQNYIGEIYTTSHLFTQEKMDQLFVWIKQAYKKIDDFEVAFQSHAQFEIIHPFIDGNGRVGRLFLNWLLLYKKLSPLAIRSQKRNSYISALHNSQRGKVKAICVFCLKEYLNQYRFV